jgi:hypothetical protein
MIDRLRPGTRPFIEPDAARATSTPSRGQLSTSFLVSKLAHENLVCSSLIPVGHHTAHDVVSTRLTFFHNGEDLLIERALSVSYEWSGNGS